jgi:hypothetical protein
MTDEAMASPAWLWKPWGSKLGVLALIEGRLSFRLPRGKVPFEAPLDEVEVLGWPSYGIAPNSQVKLRVGGKKHRVSFIAPVNSAEVVRIGDTTAFGGEGAMMARAVRAARTYPAGKETGAAWRARLSPDEVQSDQAAGS